MTFEPDFLRQMTSTVTVKPATDNADGYGDPSFGTAVVVPAHITVSNKMIRTDREEDANSTAQVIIPPPGYVWGVVTVPTLTVADHVIMPDTTERRVLNVTVHYDETGAHHQTLDLT